jgi:peptidyl-prolyl cis-trans isomerase D
LAVAEGDFPEAILLDDGGLVALRLDAVVPPEPIPFEEAREAVAEALAAERLAAALSARATEIKAAIEGGAALGGFGIVERTAGITRDGFVEGAPPELVQAVFAMSPGDLRVIEAEGYVALVRLDEITAAEGDARAALAASIAAQASQAIGQDALSLFIGALSAEAGITLDQTAINAVNAQFN